MLQYLPKLVLGVVVGSAMLGTGHAENHVVTRVVHQFPKPTWLENIGTLSTGHILTGTLGAHAELHLIDPSTNTATLLHNFTQQNSVFGFDELEPGVWAVATGNYSPSAGAEQGSSVLWRVDLKARVAGGGGRYSTAGDVKVDKIIEMKDIGVSNGLAVVNPRTVLIADSIKGHIARIRLPSKKGEAATYDVAIDDVTTRAGDDNPSMPLSANGLQYVAPYVYFSNTNRGLVARVAVDAETAAPSAPVEVLSDAVPVVDDLAVSPDGKAVYVARPYANTVEMIKLPGNGTAKAGAKPEVVVGAQGSTEVAGVTSVTFGRGKADQRVLYVSTYGGNNAEAAGTYLEGGKVVAVYLDGVSCKGNVRRYEVRGRGYFGY